METCLHCHHTGWIHTDDDVPDQMCPYCFVGKAVIKCYNKTTQMQLGDLEQAKLQHDDLLAACKEALAIFTGWAEPSRGGQARLHMAQAIAEAEGE